MSTQSARTLDRDTKTMMCSECGALRQVKARSGQCNLRCEPCGCTRFHVRYRESSDGHPDYSEKLNAVRSKEIGEAFSQIAFYEEVLWKLGVMIDTGRRRSMVNGPRDLPTLVEWYPRDMTVLVHPDVTLFGRADALKAAVTKHVVNYDETASAWVTYVSDSYRQLMPR